MSVVCTRSWWEVFGHSVSSQSLKPHGVGAERSSTWAEMLEAHVVSW